MLIISKTSLRKEKPLYGKKHILNEGLLKYLKEKAPLYLNGVCLKNNQYNKKEDTPMNSFPKTAYCSPLFTNAESVEETTNPYLKIIAPHLF